uniref:Galectin n=1 Tax=Strongyloides papillosus TaxID=174720 RepID=A0A0N5BK44_STREA
MSAESHLPVPYRSKLTDPFEPGQTLMVKGKTIPESKRFSINLHAGSAEFDGTDIPFHISIRFDEGKFVFNTFNKGEWMKEERKSNPYKKGSDIDIRIRAHDNRFVIYADQKEIHEYEHRVPLSTITHFSVDGDVDLQQVTWGGKYYPVPYESGITGDGLVPGKSLVIHGIPEKKGKSFTINLLNENGDVALNFNSKTSDKHIVRNARIGGEWGNEEKEGKSPLQKGVGFDLEIKNEPYSFQIFINGHRFATFAHRVNPDGIKGLQINGDVEITGIQLV